MIMNTVQFIRAFLFSRMKIIFLLSFLCEQSYFPQSFQVHSYSVEDGIASNGVHDVTQDKTGIMWFATDEGVSSYDGSSWRNYSTSDGLPRVDYYKIKYDDNTIWAIPNWNADQIAFFKNNKWNLIKKPISGKGDVQLYTAFDLHYDNGNLKLILGTHDGIYIYSNGVWTHLTKSNGLLDNQINFIKSYNGSVYVCTEKGVSVIHDGKIDNSLNSLIKVRSKKIIGIEFAANHKEPGSNSRVIWLFGRGWIGNIHGNNFSLITSQANYIRSDRYLPRNFFARYDGKNKIYYGDEFQKYIYEINRGKIIPLDHENGFNSLGSTSICIDHEGNIWFPSYRGIDKVTNLPFQNFYRSNGLLENEVSAILQVRPGFLIFGHENGLTLYKGNSFRTIKIEPKSSVNYASIRVMGLCKDSAGTVWIAATQLGIGKLINESRIEWLNKDKYEQTYSMATDKNGTVWIGSNRGLEKIVNNKIVEVCCGNEYSEVRRVYVDRQNQIWAGRAGSLIHYANGRCSQINLTGVPFGTVVYAITDYNDDEKLLGTSAGLFVLKGNSFSTFGNSALKIDKKIFFINRDNRKNYWFGTNNGVIKWDGKTSRRYSIEGGLAGHETNRAAFVEDSFGNIWIGTDRGLSRFIPEYDIKENPPEIFSLGLETSDEKHYQLDKSLEFQSSQNDFIFHFKALSFKNEKYIMYRVRLEGFESNWNELGSNTQARYSNLSPGSYRLMVSTRNRGGDWSKTVYSSIITIGNPFYLKWWFVGFVLTGLSALLYLAYTYLAQVKYGKELLREVENRTRELKQSENKLRAIIDNAPNIITIIDSVGKVKFINQKYEENINITSIGDSIFDLIQPELHDEVNDKLKQIFENKKTVVFEHRSKIPVGHERWLMSYVSPILTEGKITEAIAISIDVTAQKKLETERKENEERQAAILEAIPVILYTGITPSAFDASWMTENVKSVTGFTHFDFTQKKSFWIERIHPEDKQKVETAFLNVREGKSIKIEYRWMCADGNYKWFLDYESPRPNGNSGSTEYFGIWLDITDQKVAEIRLQKLNRIFLNFGTDPKSNIRKLVELCGEELDGACAEYLFIKDEKLNSLVSWQIPVDLETSSKPVGSVCYNVVNTWKKEFYVMPDLNRTEYAELDPLIKFYGLKTFFGIPVAFGNQIMGTLCIFYFENKLPVDSDINFMKILASAIAVEEVRRISEEQLQKSLKEQQILLKEIHHRVKNNLQIISSLLYLQTEKITDKDVLNAFKESHNRIRSMALVHEELYQSHDLSSISFDDYTDRLVHFLLDSYTNGRSISYRSKIENIRLTVDKAIPCGLIINEIVTNSIKYAFPSNFGDAEIFIEIEVNDRKLKMTIGDNGIGLPPEIDLEGSNDSLGLKLVALLVYQLEGTIQVDREKGTKFIITFNFS